MGIFSRKSDDTVSVPFGTPKVPLPSAGVVLSTPSATPRKPIHIYTGAAVLMNSREPGTLLSVYASGECKVATGAEVRRMDVQALSRTVAPALDAATLSTVLTYLQCPVTPGLVMDDIRQAGLLGPTAVASPSVSDAEESSQMRAGKRAMATPNNIQHGYADRGSAMSVEEAHQKYFGQDQ